MRRLHGPAALLVLTCAFAASTVPALAHAVLEQADPAAGARVDRAPAQITLTFDEPVETSLGSLRVFDGSGALIAGTGAVTHPGGDASRIAVHVPSLPRGRYVVVWRVVSVDTHIVSGAYAFGLGVPAGAPPPLERDPVGAVATPIIHGLLLASTLLAIGLPIGALALGVAETPAGIMEFGAWLIVALAAFADIALRAAINGGTLAASFDTRAGLMRTTTMISAIAGVIALAGRRRRWLMLAAAGVGLVLSLSLAGHAADGGIPALGVAADALHLVGAAAWIGVLAIGATLGPAIALRRISPFAVAAVATIVLTGIVQTLRNVGSWAWLFASAYGRAIDLKILLMTGAIAIAWTARRSLARGTFTIRRRLAAELALLALVVGVTAVLVDLPLPREAAAADASRAATAAPTPLTLHVRDIDVAVGATPAGPQRWTMHVAGTGPGGVARSLDEVDVSVTESTRHAGPFTIPMTRDPAGAYDGTIDVPFDGRWSAFVSARSGDFDEAHATMQLSPNHEETTP
jgi:copper transport protein